MNKYYHAASAAPLLSCHRPYRPCEGREQDNMLITSIHERSRIPAPLCVGSHQIYIPRAGQGAVRVKILTLTIKTIVNHKLVRAVSVVTVNLTYRTCAHARACLSPLNLSILFFIIIKTTLTTLTSVIITHIYALTMFLDHPDHIDQKECR